MGTKLEKERVMKRGKVKAKARKWAMQRENGQGKWKGY